MFSLKIYWLLAIINLLSINYHWGNSRYVESFSFIPQQGLMGDYALTANKTVITSMIFLHCGYCELLFQWKCIIYDYVILYVMLKLIHLGCPDKHTPIQDNNHQYTIWCMKNSWICFHDSQSTSMFMTCLIRLWELGNSKWESFVQTRTCSYIRDYLTMEKNVLHFQLWW